MFARLFSSKPSLDIKIELDRNPDNEKYRLPYFAPDSFIFTDTDKVTGAIVLQSNNGRSVLHDGLTVALIGQVRVKSDDSLHEFYRISERVLASGSVTSAQRTTFALTFTTRPAPSYYGSYYDCRYIVVATCGGASATMPVYILSVDPLPGPDIPSLGMEMGITNLLRVAFALQSPTFDVSSCLIGVIEFTEVRIRVVRMIFQVIRVEEYQDGMIGSRGSTVVAQYELIDGVPGQGQRIPVRIYFPGMKLWPFSRPGASKLVVGYSLRFVLFDESGKKYFKEITKNIVRLKK